jgi:hypothetical protein
MRGFAILTVAMALAGCASSAAPPSLLPRPAEAIDPRVEVVRPMNDRPVNASLAGQLAALVGEARSGDAAFGPAAAEAQRLAASAGAPQSESWIAAEEALSRAVAAKEATARALGDIDSLGGDRLQANSGMAPSDLAAVQQASAQVFAIDQRQSETIKSIQAALGR